jgi:hypothetical protein
MSGGSWSGASAGVAGDRPPPAPEVADDLELELERRLSVPLAVVVPDRIAADPPERVAARARAGVRGASDGGVESSVARSPTAIAPGLVPGPAAVTPRRVAVIGRPRRTTAARRTGCFGRCCCSIRASAPNLSVRAATSTEPPSSRPPASPSASSGHGQ